MKTLNLFFLFLFISTIFANAQTKFHRTYGTVSPNEVGYSVQQTTDGGYILVGSTSINGNEDVYLIKTDSDGDTIWTKTYGGSNTEQGFCVVQTLDGGYIIAGLTDSYGAGGIDAYVIKTNTTGDVTWARTYGYADDDGAESIQQTNDGGYILTGFMYSLVNGINVYLVKIKPNGDISWTRSFGGVQDDYGYEVRQTFDGGYIIVGKSSSMGAGSYDVYLIKTNSSGTELWSKTYGGTDQDIGYSVRQTDDGGYILCGSTLSFGAGFWDVYVIKTQSTGDTLWTKTFGGINSDVAHSVQRTADRGYIIAGYSYTTDAEDFYAIKTDTSGNLSWQKKYNNSSNLAERSYSIQQTTDNGFILVGNSGDDIYLVKTLDDGCAIRVPEIIITTSSNKPNTICEGEDVILEVNRDFYIYNWSTGESTKSINIGDNAGNYTISVTDIYGCVENSSILSLSQLPMPIIEVLPNGPTTYCPGTLTSVTLNAVQLGYPKYLWNTGGTNSSFVATEIGDYTLTVTDTNDCKNTSDTVSIEYYQPYENEVICVVTVDTVLNKNVIVWERTSGKRTSYYNVYKETIQANVYEIIGSVLFEKLSVFVDKSSFPKKKADRYKITSMDSCGTESSRSDFHRTLHLTVNTGPGVINLIWEHYEGINFLTYKIYRGNSSGNLVLYDQIQSNLFTYTDISPTPGLSFYQLGMVMPDTCSPVTVRGLTSSGPYSQSLSNLKDYSFAGNSYLTVSPNFQTIYSIGDTVSINIYTSLSNWTATSSESWLTLLSNVPDNQITAIASNNTGSAREATITVEADGVDPQTAIIIQSEYGTNITEYNQKNTLTIYPNPYSEQANITYTLNTSSNVKLEVYNIVGKKVCELVNQRQLSGKYQYGFNAKSLGYSDGLYLLIFQVDDNTTLRKLIEIQ